MCQPVRLAGSIGSETESWSNAAPTAFENSRMLWSSETACCPETHRSRLSHNFRRKGRLERCGNLRQSAPNARGDAPVHHRDDCVRDEHSAFDGQTPDEMYFGHRANIPDELAAKSLDTQRRRVEQNLRMACTDCSRREVGSAQNIAA